PFDKEARTKTIADVERSRIMKILDECEYNQVKAAEMLGIHRDTLSRKIKEYNIDLTK
ncbi:MAG TPA: sigma-54-dependent Fis family transcriptional regulator, partial [Candidatus Cloacimonetes bacterium]|nr:sigma-54-dependent Fis family transcriptional regulator [Candidatus Cloacimonadota bacterium]